MEERSKAYLDSYLSTLPTDVACHTPLCDSDYYCADEYNVNLCAQLILKGEKQASCSLGIGTAMKMKLASACRGAFASRHRNRMANQFALLR